VKTVDSIINQKENSILVSNGDKRLLEFKNTEFETVTTQMEDHSAVLLNNIMNYLEMKENDKDVQEMQIEVENLILDSPILEPYLDCYKNLLSFVGKSKLFYVEELITLLKIKKSIPKYFNTLPIVKGVLIDFYFKVINDVGGLSIYSHKRESLIETLANLELYKNQLAVNQYEYLYELLFKALKDSKSTYEEEFVKGRIIKGTYVREESLYYVFKSGQKEVLLPKKRKLQHDNLQGGILNLYISEISRNKIRERIFVSRTHPVLLKSLIKAHVPLVKQKVIKVLAVVRYHGECAKVVISTDNPNINPVKVCEESLDSLNQEFPREKIEFVLWSEDRAEYLRNLFSEVELLGIENGDSDVITITVPSDTDEVHIGKNSVNLKLIKELLRCEFIIQKEMSPEELESWNRLL
jgi:transcription antitermination factor NusA-like protein